MTVVRPYRGVSADQRRADRRARLVDAVLNVIAENGVANASVDKVCAAAGLTKRYFYESFADLDALLLSAADELFDGLYAGMAEAVQSSTSAEATSAVARRVIHGLAVDPRAARLYVESPGHALLRRRREQAIAAFSDFLLNRVLKPDPVTHQQKLRVRVVVAGATDLITGFLGGTLTTTEDSVVEAVVALADAV